MATQDWRAMLAVIDRHVPAVRRGFLDAVSKARGVATRTKVERALARKDYARVVQLLDAAWAGVVDDWQALLAGQIHAALGAAGTLASTAGLLPRFNLVNPMAVQAARDASLNLVTRVTAAQRTAIRTAVAEAIQSGAPVRTAAQQLRQVLGLDARRAAALAAYTADIYARIPGRFIRQSQLVEKYAAKLLRQRALVIANTEMARAVTEGQLAAWREAVLRGTLNPQRQKQWIATPDDLWCPHCQQLHLRVVPMNALFISEVGAVEGPPLHPNCRCVVRLMPLARVPARPRGLDSAA